MFQVFLICHILSLFKRAYSNTFKHAFAIEKFVYVFVSLCVVCLSVCLSVSKCVYLYANQLACLFVCLSIFCLFVLSHLDLVCSSFRWKLLLALTSPLSVAAINMSSILQDLVFTSHTSSVTSHETHTIYRSYFSAMSHSVDVSQRVHTLKSPTLQSPICGTLFTFGQRSPTKISSPTKSVAPQLPAVTSNSTECLQDLLCDDMLPPEMTTPIAVRKLQPTSLPSFLLCCVPRVKTTWIYIS